MPRPIVFVKLVAKCSGDRHVEAIAAPQKLGRREAYALIAAESQLLEDYRWQLERELKCVNGRIELLGSRCSAGTEKPSPATTGLWR